MILLPLDRICRFRAGEKTPHAFDDPRNRGLAERRGGWRYQRLVAGCADKTNQMHQTDDYRRNPGEQPGGQPVVFPQHPKAFEPPHSVFHLHPHVGAVCLPLCRRQFAPLRLLVGRLQPRRTLIAAIRPPYRLRIPGRHRALLKQRLVRRRTAMAGVNLRDLAVGIRDELVVSHR